MLRRIVRAKFVRRALFLSIAIAVCTFFIFRFTDTRAKAAGGTRLLRTPTVSATQIAFAYAQNIWSVPRAGGTARRLTSFQGQTSNPHFSPDGKWIAFSGEYAGNLDVYVVSADGGEPKRLTWKVPARTPCRVGHPTAGQSCFRHHARPGRRAARRASGLSRLKVASKDRWSCRVAIRARSPPTDRTSLIG